jgi:hypothetical protein
MYQIATYMLELQLNESPLLKIYKPKMQLTKQKTEYPPSTEELHILCNTNVFWKIFLTDCNPQCKNKSTQVFHFKSVDIFMYLSFTFQHYRLTT